MDSTLAGPPADQLLDGRYRVTSSIAHGGMASVYLGVDTRLDRTVAIKIMHPELAADGAFVARFIREARSVAQLSHPNVVSVYDQGSDGQHLYLAMEYVAGKTLRHLLNERGRLSPREALDITESVLAGLAAAHQAGIVHRDVKPENVLLASDGRIKVADFGLARNMAGTSNHTKTGVLMGTVAYLAPEQVTASVSDARCDVYAAGVMLFELLTGRQPHVGESALAVAYKHVNETVPPPSSLAPGLAQSLDALVALATSRDPDPRPADAGQFLRALREVRSGHPLYGVPSPRPGQSPGDDFPGVVGGVGAGAAGMAGAFGTAGAMRMGGAGAEQPGAAGRGAGQHGGPGQDGFGAGQHGAGQHGAGQGGAGVGQLAVAGHDALATRPASAPYQGQHDGYPRQFDAHPGQYDGYPPQDVYPLGQHQPGQHQQGQHQQGVAGGQTVHPAGLAPFPAGQTLIVQTGERRGHQGPREPGLQRWLFSRRLLYLMLAIIVLVVAGAGAWWEMVGRYTTVPQVTRLSVSAARAELRGMGFTVTTGATRLDNTMAKGDVITTVPAPGARVRKDATVELIMSAGPKMIGVPQVSGQSLANAEAALRQAGLTPGKIASQVSATIATGVVISTDPQAGASWPQSQPVTILVSAGPPLPNFIGQQQGAAQAWAAVNGISLNVQPAPANSTQPQGTITKQSPGPNTAYASGEVVTVYVSPGPPNVAVPNVDGEALLQAVSQLQHLGFQVTTQQSGPFGRTVFNYSPSGQAPKGSTITLYYGLPNIGG
jgi:eukaryotic-like serine/threonine-protein kinase